MHSAHSHRRYAVSAHPGHDIRAEHAERQTILDLVGRSDYGRCADKLKARGVEARAVARREELAKKMMKKRNLEGTHQSNSTFTLQIPVADIFASTDFCFLSPEVTEGPYYFAGEYIREDITEDQAGVDLALDLQVYDVETCEPVPNVYLEIWHCNTTGVYSGVSAGGNGNGDASNLNATFLRGLQQTDADGIAQFETLFPGHYTGRTNHIHVMVHVDLTVFPNNTIQSNTASHVGQIYLDQDLITEVEAEPVYNTNTQPHTINAEDMLFQQGSQVGDPVVNYVYLGSAVSEGLLGWIGLIGFGINTTLARTVSAAATLYESGGVANPNAGGPGGGPGGFPSGFPTASASASASSSAVAAPASSPSVAAPACKAKAPAEKN
ncbi:Intradiol ring-cleavage dioxygenase [Pseudoneurospora amorphoporcata]|uniref:Intradiol ring-cleavage dioxygenase n=1 Tax=Pseudoneurospora amorphoporcata TaxID=241081 RepID=A0AAN6NRJ2_9PEZI|nr:Intradiol ring-cleavage dioxygenase [Pseudoneurospora amorphoporcata]